MYYTYIIYIHLWIYKRIYSCVYFSYIYLLYIYLSIFINIHIVDTRTHINTMYIYIYIYYFSLLASTINIIRNDIFNY